MELLLLFVVQDTPIHDLLTSKGCNLKNTQQMRQSNVFRLSFFDEFISLHVTKLLMAHAIAGKPLQGYCRIPGRGIDHFSDRSFHELVASGHLFRFFFQLFFFAAGKSILPQNTFCGLKVIPEVNSTNFKIS